MSTEVETRVVEATERLLRDGAPFTQLSLMEISKSVDRAVSEHVRACEPAEDGALAEALTRFARLVILGIPPAAA